jgi:uncharacterized membrane protein
LDKQQAVQTLITDQTGVFMFLLFLVGVIFFVSEFPPLRKFFSYVPPLVFCYFLPMLATTFGIIPEQSPVYDWVNATILPPIIILLLLSADMKAIIRLGPRALTVMLSGCTGIVFGSFFGYLMVRNRVDPLAWQSVGALAASWTGGSANLAAVKVALEIPDPVLSPMFVVDPVMAYSWMGLLLAMAGMQTRFAARFNSDTRILETLDRQIAESQEAERPITTRDLLLLLAIAFVSGYLCAKCGAWLGDRIKTFASATFEQQAGGGGSVIWASLLKTFSASTITVIFVTLTGIAMSFSPIRKLEPAGASKLGYAFLYLLIPTFGARANLTRFEQIPWYAVIGLVMILSHAVFIFAAVILTRSPLFIGATASQANVGGPASAAVVASAYQPKLAPVGVLLGIFGGILGTFIGLATAQLCRLIAP